MIGKKHRIPQGFRSSVTGIIIAGLVMSGCVTGTLEVDGRGNLPIAQKTVTSSKLLHMTPLKRDMLSRSALPNLLHSFLLMHTTAERKFGTLWGTVVSLPTECADCFEAARYNPD